MIDRRAFVASISASLAAWPEPLLAQTAKGKIGYLHPVTISPNHITFSILRKEWQRLVVGSGSVPDTTAAGVADRLWDISDIAKLVEAAEQKPAKRGPYNKRAQSG